MIKKSKFKKNKHTHTKCYMNKNKPLYYVHMCQGMLCLNDQQQNKQTITKKKMRK